MIAGYTMSYAMLLIAGARLGDRFGHGRAFRAGLTGFTLASLACGLAPNTAMLLLVVPLVLGHEEDWPLWGWVSLAASVPMFAISVLVERSIARRGGSPLVSGRVFAPLAC